MTFATRSTFHAARFWLNEVAPLKVRYMLDTLALFHEPMSALSVELEEKSEAMLVTAAVFQSPMLPYAVAAVVGSVAHAVAAVPTLPSTRHALLSLLHAGYAVRSVAPQSR